MSLIAYIQKDYHRWKIDKIAIFLANKESLNINIFAYIPSLIMGNFLVLI